MSESLLKSPAVHPLLSARTVGSCLELGDERYSRCREEIDPDYGALSALVVHHNTQACGVANSISGFDAFVPLALIGSVIIYVIDYASGSLTLFPFVFIWSVIPLIPIVVWFFRFGRFRIGDDEYLRA